MKRSCGRGWIGLYACECKHNSIGIEMAEQERPKLVPAFRQVPSADNSSTRIHVSFNSPSHSLFPSSRDPTPTQDNKHKIYHALSARKLNNNSLFTLSQLGQALEPDRSKPDKAKRISENQLEEGRKERSSHPRFKLEEAKNTNRNICSLLEAANKEEPQKMRCKECEGIFKAKQKEVETLVKEAKNWQAKFQKLQEKHDDLRKKFEPYTNNLNLLSVMVDHLQEKEKEAFMGEVSEQAVSPHYRDRYEVEESAKVTRWLLKEGKERDKFYHSQTFRLNCQVDVMRSENSKLKGNLHVKDNKIRGLEEQLRYYESNNSMRERLEMCRQQLYTYKLKYQQKDMQAEALGKKLEEARYKLTILTSLIGCAIIFDLKEKDNDKVSLKEFINKIDKYQTITHNILENNGFQYLKFYEHMRQEENRENKEGKQGKEGKEKNPRIPKSDTPAIISKAIQYRRLYYPNYLILLGEESIAARAEHVIIKPLLFIKMRAILDSKYIDYRLFQNRATGFAEFCSSYLKNYDILEAEKKPYLLIRQISENEIKEMSINFFKCLLDERIHDLPEVQMFREFLLGRWEEDEVYFYLMCRHKFLEGNELQNFINSGDPSKFIRFDKAKRILLRLTDCFGRNIQNFICHHLNERRIVKPKGEFVRVYYILKVLLLIYRKVRAKKIDQFRQCFESVLAVTRRPALTFLQFGELLKKNFQFLTRCDACKMYRTTYALFQSQKNQPNFYECFVAVCLPTLFLQQLVRQDKQLQLECMSTQQILTFSTTTPLIERKTSKPQDRLASQLRLSAVGSLAQRSTHSNFKNTSPRVNPLNQLWPDSVYILGNEALNREYVDLLKNSNWEEPRVRLETLILLAQLAKGHLVKQNIYLKEREALGILLGDAIFNLIEFLNRIEKQKIQYENEVNLASRKIGRFFKNKVYEFYHEMLEDVNSIKTKPTVTPTSSAKRDLKNKRYFKEKIRASKVFTAFKLN